MIQKHSIPWVVVPILPALLCTLLAAVVYYDAFPIGRLDVILAIAACAVAMGGAGIVLFAMRQTQLGNARLGAIVDSAGDGIMTTDEEGYIEAVNPSAVVMFRYRPGQMAGTRFPALLSSAYREPEESPSFQAFLDRNQIKANGSPHLVTGLRREGTPFHMDLSVTRAPVDDQETFIIVVRDVSERVAAQEALRQARDELEERVRARTSELEAANTLLQTEIAERKRTQEERERLISEIQEALSKIKTLSGMLPICANCKKIRDDKGYWNQIEDYVSKHSEAVFSHGVCPDCMRELYPEVKMEER